MLELKGVVKNYKLRDKQVEALRGVDLVFPQKGLVFVVGKSGSGKSTMLNILGLLDNFDAGDFLIDGKSVKDFTPKEKDIYRALNIGFVFQEFHIIAQYTVGQNLMLPLQIQHSEISREEVEATLKKVDMQGYFDRKPSEISGGQKQRIAIARAIIKNPKIVLADEPTGNLDSVNSTAVFELLKQLSKDRLIIVISHDMESAHKYADSIVELKDGRVAGVYKAGNKETVSLTVEKIDKQAQDEINELLASGKKVLISGSAPPPDIEKNASIEDNTASLLQTKKVKLPLKSSLRLSLLSIRARSLRTFFTVLVAMFAIAFFGFSDIIAQFDVDKVLADEIQQSGLSFINVSAQKMRENEFFPKYDDVYMSTEHYSEFDGLKIPYIKKYALNGLSLMANSYVNYFPQRSIHPYYDENVRGVIEIDDLSKIGLELSQGRMPENHDEIVITNYHLQTYSKFGLKTSDNIYGSNQITIASEAITNITEFSQIQDKPITLPIWTQGTPYGLTFKIVGMIDFDLSQFDEIAGTKVIDSVTDAQRELLYHARLLKQQYLNNWFALPGFFEKHNIHFSRVYLQNFSFGFGGLTYDTKSVINYPLEPNIAGLSILKDNFTASDISTNQVIVSIGLLLRLLPAGALDGISIDMRLASPVYEEEYRRLLNENVFGRTLYVSVSTSFADYPIECTNVPLEIVGVWNDSSRGFFPSVEFYEPIRLVVTDSVIVPAASKKDTLQALNTIGASNFVLEDETFRFVVSSPYSEAIYELESYFIVFVDIFRYISLVFFVFAMLLTYSFISHSISSRKRDIGILRSLGAGRLDVAGIFIIEGIFIALAIIALGAATCGMGFALISKYFVQSFGYLAQTYSLVSFGVRQVFLIAALTFAAVAVSILIPIIRISNKQPVNAIRD